MRANPPLVAALAATVALAAATPAAGGREAIPSTCPGARAGVVFYRAAAHGWQARHDAPRTPTRHAERKIGCDYVRWAARRWQARAHAARSAYEAWFEVMLAKWDCIHDREGSWSDANSGGAGHYGGLQMDLGFQGTYGSEFLRRWGTADRWPVYAQLLAAERAFHGYGGHGPRGFRPWPNTARDCDLL